MIDFSIPPDLEEIRGRVADFVRDEVLPVEATAFAELEGGVPALAVARGGVAR